MTYLEKVMQRIKLDKELLTEEQAEKLKEEMQPVIGANFCPGDFIIGGPMQMNHTCPKSIHCWICWHQEADEQ
ncbi:MAG: hypothetical protein SOR75_11355 [Synergistes jonesii]|uniref:hypothetical protein n=1 Tax=Synergistes jonesii TaxID=2754 RepID=UPI002A76644E|nr:hypothetical protein [Synergistes jonesii]MDY2985906.1 hypothetical protein [Synergistes jonesii]